MKLTITNGVATVISETKEEARKLADLVLAPVKKEKKTKQRKAWGGFNCDHCDYKGTRRGLAVHQAQAHGIYSKNHEYNKKYRLRRQGRIPVQEVTD